MNVRRCESQYLHILSSPITTIAKAPYRSQYSHGPLRTTSTRQEIIVVGDAPSLHGQAPAATNGRQWGTPVVNDDLRAGDGVYPTITFPRVRLCTC